MASLMAHLYHISLLGFLALLAGCATPQVALDKTAETDLNAFNREIYLFDLDEERDPQKVLPRVVAGLEARGFHVELVDKAHPLHHSQGTAMLIDEQGHLLTCSHLFDDQDNASEATVWLKGERFEADVLKRDEDADLALLRLRQVPAVPLQPVVLPADGSAPLRMGDEVFTIGYPLSDVLGKEPRLNQGFISATVGMDDDEEQMQISAEIQPGNSGGPLFNREREVIGVVASTLNSEAMMEATGGATPQNINFALKRSVIEEFLEDQPVELVLSAPTAENPDFETLSESVAQIRSTIISDEMLASEKLACMIMYHSVGGIKPRFLFFQLLFVDLNNEEVILAAGQHGDNFSNNEDKTIEATLDEVAARLAGSAE